MDRKRGQGYGRNDAGISQYVFTPSQQSGNQYSQPSNGSSGSNTFGGRYSNSANNRGDSRQSSQQSGIQLSQPSSASSGSNIFGARTSKSAANSGDSQQPSQPSGGSQQANRFGISLSGSGIQGGGASGRSQQGYSQARGNAFDADGQNSAPYFGDAARSSQSAYDPPRLSVFGSGSQNLFGQAGIDSSPAQQASRQSQPAPSSGIGRQPTHKSPTKDGVPFPVYEAIAKLHLNQVVDLTTQLAKEKASNEYMRAKLARQAEKEAALRPPPQQVQFPRKGHNFYQDGSRGHWVAGYWGKTTLAELLLIYAQHTGQDVNDLELFHKEKMVNLSLKMGELRYVWRFEVRKARR